jgi:hypothetical protein
MKNKIKVLVRLDLTIYLFNHGPYGAILTGTQK